MDNNSMVDKHADVEFSHNEKIKKNKKWICVPQIRNILRKFVSRSFINIPNQNYKFSLRRMKTIDLGELTSKHNLSDLPSTDYTNVSDAEHISCTERVSSVENISMIENISCTERVSSTENASFVENICNAKNINEYDGTAQTNIDREHLNKNNKCIIDEVNEFKKQSSNISKIKNKIYNSKINDTKPSFGTQFHDKGTCNPCRYEWTRGCHMGQFCRFCHHSSHVPLGTERVIPDPKILATTKVRPENILTFKKIASYSSNMSPLIDATSSNYLHDEKEKTNNIVMLNSAKKIILNNANGSNNKKTNNYKIINNYKNAKVYKNPDTHKNLDTHKNSDTYRSLDTHINLDTYRNLETHKNSNVYQNSENSIMNNLNNTSDHRVKYYNTNYFCNYESFSNCYNKTKLFSNNKDIELHKTFDMLSKSKDTFKNLKQLSSFTSGSNLKTINSYQRIKLVS